MELLKNLELVQVVYENEGKKAIMTFLHEEAGEIREVNFNKQSWSGTQSKFVDDPEKAEKVEKWCQEYFNCDFDDLHNCVGVRKDIYDYNTYCSLWETSSVDKFTDEELGLIDEAVIKEIKLDDVGIKIHIEYEGKTYENKMVYAKWVDGMKKFFINPQEKVKKLEQFKNKFGVDVENKDELIGRTVMFEVKKAGGRFIWVDIKPLVKKNKKK